MMEPSSTPTAPVTVRPSGTSETTNVKELIESILVAFILAIVFRTFIVEAFVIPTGSMAPTLRGAHVRTICQDCGYRFEVNYGTGDEDGAISIPGNTGRRDTQLTCPNCGFEVHAKFLPVHYGDRILVLKYVYLLRDPQRWDVVVFKTPDAKHERDRFVQNYIKRLVGRPGESIMLLDGDVYAAPGPVSEVSAFRVQTKPYDVQQALWRVIHDNDFQPRGLARDGQAWKQPWTVLRGNGWDLGGRAFRFDNLTGESSIFFDHTADPDTHAFTDWLAYNSTGSRGNVSDLKLDFYYDRQAGDGSLRLKLRKRGDTFIAEITPTVARLYHETRRSIAQVGEDVPLRASRRPMRVEFSNVDYQVTLRIDGEDVLRTTPEQYGPDLRRLLEESERRTPAPLPHVEISAEGQTAQITHLGLFRDVYYINRGQRLDGSPLWASPAHIMHLGPDEFFVLGDNSASSSDARYWTDRIELPYENLNVESGRVPGRFLLGRALFVYWPAGYQIGNSGPAIVPNFGDMRFIH